MRFIFILWMICQEVISLKTCTSQFCPPVLEKRKITLDRETPLKLVGIDDINGCICRELPNVYSLCYNANDKAKPCVRFPKNIKLNTTALLLKSTYITKISYGDFEHLEHLEILTIDGNQRLLHIDPFVFGNMTNLTTLSLIFNPSLSSLDPHTFEGLVNLKELNLVKNGFRSIKVISVTLSPNILPNLFKLNLNENVFRNVSEFDFEPMTGSSVEELNMILCGIQYIHPKSLAPLKNLSALRVGENRFDGDTFNDLLKEVLDEGIALNLLDLYSSGFRATTPRSLLELVARSNISSLILARNQFDVIDNDTFPVLMPNLILLDLTDVSAQSIDDHAFFNLPNLKTLILGKNRLSYFAASKYLPNLTYLDLQANTDSYGWEFFLTKSEFHRMRLEYLDLQFTRLLLLTITDFGYMPHLRILNLKNCTILRIEENTFKGMTNLKFLNLENNRFFPVWTNYYFDIFGGLTNLEILLLGGNGITTVTSHGGYMFKHLTNLKHLGLSRNNLQIISQEDFAPLTNLEVLDISYNYLLAWDSRVFVNNNLKKFYGSVNKMTHLSDAMMQDFRNLTYIEIDFNSFLCDCGFDKKTTSDKIALTRFLNVIKDRDVSCLRPPNTTLNIFLRTIIDSSLDCDMKEGNMLVIVIPSAIIFGIIIVLGILGYVYRWHIRYWSFLVRLYLTRKGKIRNSAAKGYTNYQFDAFVSYCNQDQNFVVRLVRMLENYEPYLKLCVYERDFQVGSVISESVLEHIAKSRKTLLIVSNAYAKSYWCTWETQIAEHHRLFFENPNGDYVDESIVLIKLGSITETHLTPTLKYLLKTRIYLQWDPDDEKQKVFWQRLRQFLEPAKNQILQCTHL